MWTQDQTIKNAVLDPSKPVMTRDGKKVTILSTEGDSLIAFVEKGQSHPSSGGLWALRVYNVNGKYFGSTGADSCVDLVNCPPTKVKKEGWVNIYPVKETSHHYKHHVKVHQSGVYVCKQSAVSAAVRANKMNTPFPVDTVKIEWEEEQ